MDEFTILRPLGRGGMGHVYLGHDSVLDRRVALKFIAGEADLAVRGRFLVEARAIARLQHPNVVAIYRIGDVLGRPYLCTGLPPRGTISAKGGYREPAFRDPAPLGSLVRDVPVLFSEVVDRCLQRDPEQRYASALELSAALDEVARLLRLLQRTPSRAPDSAEASVAASFARLEPRALDLSVRFYANLFAARPDFRALFPADLSEQQLKLVGALELAIEHLHRPERLLPLLEELGRRHRYYGVRAADFDVVGSALLGALSELDAAHWTPALEAAWRASYQAIASAMQRGLSEEPLTPPP